MNSGPVEEPKRKRRGRRRAASRLLERDGIIQVVNLSVALDLAFADHAGTVTLAAARDAGCRRGVVARVYEHRVRGVAPVLLVLLAVGRQGHHGVAQMPVAP